MVTTTETSDWRPLTARSRLGFPSSLNGWLNGDESPTVTPFVRLARAQALQAAASAAFAVALAGTLFFPSGSFESEPERDRILLFLVLTLAPFALVGPLIGPALDRVRGGRQLMLLITLALSAVVMVLAIPTIDSVWLFPIAFLQLVLGKTWAIARAAVVPATTRTSDELVAKNARLAVLSGITATIGAGPALLLQLIDSSLTLGYAAVLFLLGVLAARRIPRVDVEASEERADTDVRTTGVRLAGSAVGVLRAIDGFVFFLFAFAFTPDINNGIGAAVGSSIREALGFDLESAGSVLKLSAALGLLRLGNFVGNLLAPRLRRSVAEEWLVFGGMAAIVVAAVAGLWAGGASGAIPLAFVIGVGATVAKLSFDALVQRDAPGANLAAAFGRFETRFQIMWVIGALIPTVLDLPLSAGFIIVAAASLFAAVTYFAGVRNSGAPGAPSISFGAPSADDSGRMWAAPPTTEVPQVDAGEPVGATVAPAPSPTRSSAPATPRSAPAPQPPQPPPPLPPGAPAPPSRVAADPYAAAFADDPVEPPHWIEDRPLGSGQGDLTGPPSWLADHSPEAPPPLSDTAPEPAPPPDEAPPPPRRRRRRRF